MLPASLLMPLLCIACHQTERLWPAWSLVTRQRAPGHSRPDRVPWAGWSPSLNEPDVGVLFWALHHLPSVLPLLGQLNQPTVFIPVFIALRPLCSRKSQGEVRVRLVVVLWYLCVLPDTEVTVSAGLPLLCELCVSC